MADDDPSVFLWYWGRRGGGAAYTTRLAATLADVLPRPPVLGVSRQSEQFDAVRALGLPTAAIDTYATVPQFIGATLKVPLLRRRFARTLRESGTEVVLHSMIGPWTGLFCDIPRRLGIPLVTVIHDAEPHPGDESRLMRFSQGRALRASDHFICLSGHVAERLSALHGIAPDRITVSAHGPLDYGMDATRPPRAAPVEEVRLTFFGRIMAYKGIDLLLRAFRIARARDARLTLRIVGNGDMSPYMNLLSDLPGVTLDVRWIDDAEIAGIAEATDVFVLPYVEASQSGVPPIAMVAGVPCAATPVGGLTEQVTDGVSGVVAAETTPEAFADALLRLAGDPVLFERCAAGARAALDGPQGWGAVAGDTVDALRAATGRRPLRPGRQA